MDTRSQAEDWLSVLLWGTEMMLFPTVRNLTEGYEAWAYRQRRLQQQFRRLEQRQLIRREAVSWVRRLCQPCRPFRQRPRIPMSTLVR